MIAKSLNDALRTVAFWPEQDQAELAELAKGIEARRTGQYIASEDELKAVDEADASGIATVADVEAAFNAFRQV